MGANGMAPWPYKTLNEHCKAEIYSLGSEEICSKPNRMEAGFYASEGYRAAQAMESSGFQIETVGDLATVIWFGPFARKYVENPNHGVPFLTSSTMLEAKPAASKLISIKHTANLNELIIRENYILVSCSGTIGNVIVCTKDVDGWACSQDAIRVIAQNEEDLGPIYCYLQSPLGQFLLKRSQSGSVVTHIYESDVGTLPIPRLPRRLRQELTLLIKQASALRVEASGFFDEAKVRVLKEIQGPEIEPYKSDQTHFSFAYREIATCFAEEGYKRLDAHFYAPKVLEIRSMIKKYFNYGYLGDLVRDIVLIGKTFVPGVSKVESDYGIPFFTGKELFKVRIKPATFITSPKRSDISRLLVSEGTILVTCAGTVGKVSLVGNQLDATAVTHDAIRIVPNHSLDGGYIFAFLSGPLGQEQLQRCRYGSVIPRLHKTQLERIVIPIPGDKGREIGSIARCGSSRFSLAVKVEDEALSLFNKALRQGCEATEHDWGKDY